MNKNLISQIYKFVVVGFINTVIDFGILNILSFTTGVYSGKWLILLNSASFLVAVTNSYFMNKYWTFAVKEGGVKTGELSQFLAVSLVGLGINTGIVYGITTFIMPPFAWIGHVLWENIAKAFATGVSLIWNFIGYKFFVFKK